MSSIIINGMQMPKDIDPGLCIEFADGIDGKRYARLYHYRHGGLTKWLEAVPVPPHGRLIDADALVKHLDGLEYKGAVKRVLIQAPTIIPAEEGETTSESWGKP